MTTLHNGRPPRPARHRAGHGDAAAARHAAAAARRPALPPAQVPPAWGWKIPDAGRAAHVTAAPEYQATTTQALRPVPVRRRVAAPPPSARRSAGTSCGARWSAWTRWPGCAPG